MQLARGNLVVDTGIYQLVALQRGKTLERIADDVRNKFAFVATDVDPGIGHTLGNQLLNSVWSHKTFQLTVETCKPDILQEVTANTMQKIIVSLFLALIAITPLHAAEDEAQSSGKSAYVSLGEPMVLNLGGKRKLTFLQISADVLVGDSDAEEAVKIHVPAIRHTLIMLLSEQDAANIKSPGKREEIRRQATSQIRQLIADLSGNENVSEVLFSSILVQ